MVAAKNTAGPLAAIASRNQRQNFTSFALTRRIGIRPYPTPSIETALEQARR